MAILWVSTFAGLARFDGVRFTIFDKANSKGIVNNRFARFFADREGVIYAQTDSGFDAQMTVMYFTNEMINGTSVPMLKTAVSGFINGLGGKFRVINIPKETSANMPITVSLRGSATVKDAIFSTNLPASFAASPQPCFKVWGTLFNPGGGTCNQ